MWSLYIQDAPYTFAQFLPTYYFLKGIIFYAIKTVTIENVLGLTLNVLKYSIKIMLLVVYDKQGTSTYPAGGGV